MIEFWDFFWIKFALGAIVSELCIILIELRKIKDEVKQ